MSDRILQMHLLLHKRNWPKESFPHEKVLAVRQFHMIGGHTFCMTAALFLVLSPLFHGLHLASCHHPHRFCNPIHSGNALCVHLCCHGHECASARAESRRVALSNSPGNHGQAHDPSTCPLCQIFSQLIKGQGLPSSQVDITPQKMPFKEASQDQTSADLPFFFNGYPRAPPAC
jgi:hypothetical protein